MNIPIMINNPLKGRKVLVVEDDLSSRLYLNKILERAETVLLNAGDGQEAIEIVRKNPDINIVLMDIQLPVMDGYVAAKKIRQLRKEMVIIAQTAFGLMDEKEKIIESGFDDYIIKPIISQVLLDKLKTVLEGEK
jgi:CheY-like chemotaxis protein